VLRYRLESISTSPSHHPHSSKLSMFHPSLVYEEVFKILQLLFIGLQRAPYRININF